jgi:ParB-like chromosome segregation protein Spo0J
MIITENLEYRVVPIADLTPHPSNPRQGNVDMIKKSLRELGQFRPIVVNAGTKTGRPLEILAGHHLVRAAAELDWGAVQVTLIDVGDVAATKILLADNRTSDMATYDDRLLAEVVASIREDLEGTGYTEEDLAAMERLLDDYVPPDSDQDIIDASDESMWPEVRARIAPPLYEAFQGLPGGDDAEKLAGLLEDVG